MQRATNNNEGRNRSASIKDFGLTNAELNSAGNNAFRVEQTVYPRTLQDARSIQAQFNIVDDFTTETALCVRVVVNSGQDYKGEAEGLIVSYGNQYNYPFVWDFSRFSLTSGGK